MQINMAVFFGGRSVEHDVSIITAQQWMEQADRTKYNLIPVYIARDGLWYTGDKLMDIGFIRSFDPAAVQRCYLPAEPGGALCVRIRKGFREKVIRRKIDVAVPAMHGMHGEDGTLQGLLELCDIPYTSCGVGASAGGMDKVSMKHVFCGAGLPILPDVSFTRDAWDDGAEAVLDRIEDKLAYPVFVKPASLGSSIGIGRAQDRDSLRACIEVAAHYDRRILVERALQSPREVNCSAMGFGNQVRVSMIEEPLRAQDFLSFDDKYLREGKTGQGMGALGRKLPADVPEDVARKVTAMTEACFRALDCKGVVRVDFLLDVNLEVYVNEINTIPGSFAYYLWEPMGISFTSLIDAMVEDAMRAYADKRRNHYAYTSQILGRFGAGGAKGGAKTAVAK
nr:D-alanine--D-alanine ligase [bacterium]